MRRRRPGEFDTFLFADYSGAEDVGAQRAAISLFRVDGRSSPRKIRGPFMRESLREAIVEELTVATTQDRRVLFGLDHQWSWPDDLRNAAGLSAVRSWRRFLTALVEGSATLPPLQAPSRYASAFNRAVGADVFHCRVHSLGKKYDLKAQSSWTGNPVRFVETLMRGAKPATRLGGTGAVAGQTLTGLKELQRLFTETSLRGLPVIAWPFEAQHDDGSSHIGCEIYPAHCKRELLKRGLMRVRAEWTEHDRDAALTCLWASRTALGPLLDLRTESVAMRRKAATEGWILGAKTTDRG